MEHKEAVTTLISLMGKHSLNAEEKDAVLTAIGVLSWSSLAKGRIKALKAKRDKAAK